MHFTINLKDGSLVRRGVNTDGTAVGESRSMKKTLCKYAMSTETVTSSDGTKVLLTIVHPKGGKSPHPQPFLLIGYGAYGFPVPLEYDSQTLALLEKGFCVGYAHCRGGGEFGAAWHTAGKGKLKRNTFDDFKACAEFLITGQWTSPSQLCGLGVSAGGLILGVMANECPHLFAALVMRYEVCTKRCRKVIGCYVTRCYVTRCFVTRCDGMGWDGMGWDGMGGMRYNMMSSQV